MPSAIQTVGQRCAKCNPNCRPMVCQVQSKLYANGVPSAIQTVWQWCAKYNPNCMPIVCHVQSKLYAKQNHKTWAKFHLRPKIRRISFIAPIFTKPTVTELHLVKTLLCGPGSSVSIATDYGLDGSGSNPGEDEIFRPSRPALGPTQPPVKCVPHLFPGYRRTGRGADPPPHLKPRS